MTNDRIVEELHRTREELLEQYGGFDGYLKHIDELQEELRDRVVSREPRRPALSGKVS